MAWFDVAIRVFEKRSQNIQIFFIHFLLPVLRVYGFCVAFRGEMLSTSWSGAMEIGRSQKRKENWLGKFRGGLPAPPGGLFEKRN